MNDQGKSDRPAVPMKSSKGMEGSGPGATELGERGFGSDPCRVVAGDDHHLRGPEHESEPVPEDLILQVPADLEPVLAQRCQGDVEVVLSYVATVAQPMPVAQHHSMADLAVVGLRPEVELQRPPGGGVREQQVRCLAVQDVREELQP